MGDFFFCEKVRILCIDDDPNLLDINKSFLCTVEGYEVMTASNGIEGLEMAKREKPDLVLLDVALEDISGYDICKQIKAFPGLLNTRVILISGLETSTESRKKGLQSGADDYVIRPIARKDLLARVEGVLG
jgi:two-component system alkaline phosphatase synthesis response regulator PhoP